MATFDAARLIPGQYTLEIAAHVLRFQATIEDFMLTVRTNPAYVGGNKQLIVDFIRLIDHDKAFPLAAMVMPELRYPQSYDTSKKTITNMIIKAPGIKRRRPPPPMNDPGNTTERELVFSQIRNAILYLAYDQRRETQTEGAERSGVEDLIEQAAEIIMPPQDND